MIILHITDDEYGKLVTSLRFSRDARMTAAENSDKLAIGCDSHRQAMDYEAEARKFRQHVAEYDALIAKLDAAAVGGA